MATATDTTSTYDTPAQVAAFNASVVKAGRRVGNLYLDGCEKVVDDVTSLQQRLADRSRSDTLKTLTRDRSRHGPAAHRGIHGGRASFAFVGGWRCCALPRARATP
jgi:hypothetical protein